MRTSLTEAVVEMTTDLILGRNARKSVQVGKLCMTIVALKCCVFSTNVLSEHVYFL